MAMLVAAVIALNTSIRWASRNRIASGVAINRWNTSSLWDWRCWTKASRGDAGCWSHDWLCQGRTAGPRGYRTHHREPEAFHIRNVMIARRLRNRKMVRGQWCRGRHNQVTLALLISRLWRLDTRWFDDIWWAFSEWFVFMPRFSNHLCLLTPRMHISPHQWAQGPNPVLVSWMQGKS